MALTSKKNNRKCIVCNSNYYYCSTCNESIKPSWYNIFHDQNCHDIYDAVANIYPEQGKQAAKEALDKLDLSNKENFHPNIRKLINEIYDITDKIENVEVVESVENVENTKSEKNDNKIIAEEKVDTVKENKTENKEENKSEVNVDGNEKTNSSIKTSNQAVKKVTRNIKNRK